MSNASYTYSQVKNGEGSYVYETPIVYSAGVKTMQERLIAVGYNISADGKFGQATETAVKGFQTECALSIDGKAGKNTLTELDKVYQSSYFTQYGKPISTSDFSRTNILAGKFGDIDLLSRIIWAEEHGILDAEAAVAQVIKNRSNNSGYYESASTYPNASVWARVIGMKNQYGTVGGSAACNPVRGDINQSDGISQYWKKAVDLASALTSGKSFTVAKGYTVNSTTVSSTKTTAVTNQYMQTALSLYKSYLNDGKVKGTVITYKSKLEGAVNIFYNI